jgi:putative DNA primase/helicase
MSDIQAADLAKALGGRRNGKGWVAKCPAHDDHNPSLSIDVGTDGRTLLKCRSGCKQRAVIDALKAKGLWAHNGTQRPTRSTIAAEYDYVDEAGTLLFQAVRFVPKKFSQRRPDGKGGWFWDLKGVRRVLYRLPEVIESIAMSRVILIVEGEKDVDNLRRLQFCATTCPQGAGKWRDEYNAALAGADVILVSDNDTAGRSHANKVGLALTGIANTIKLLELPNLPPKGDVSNWIDAGGTAEQLWALIEAAPQWVVSDPEEEPRAPEYSDEGLALLFTERHQEDLRHIAFRGHWLLWSGSYWRLDDKLQVFDRSRVICREQATEAERKGEDFAKSMASAKTVAAVERLAKADRRHATSVNQWDANRHIIATPETTVDLITGTDRPPNRYDYCTKVTAVAPAPPGTPCPMWQAFLKRVMAHDDELIAFLQRIAGYCLTGLVSEEVLFFFYGKGRNGKGVFTKTLLGILADYAIVMPMEMLMASDQDKHPTEIARLCGVRLAVSPETERNRSWAEAKIKNLTGADPLTGRFMRGDFFDFDPTHKLIVSGNHKPNLRGVDEAIKARLLLVPFTVTIPPEERNPNLKEQLKAEWPAIFRWMIDGCREWREKGLMAPQAVRAATAQYMADQDTREQWFQECVTVSNQHADFAPTETLFGSWRGWCARRGLSEGTSKALGTWIEERGHERGQHSRTRRGGFKGLIIQQLDQPEQPGFDLASDM